jgi:hypothetical protein
MYLSLLFSLGLLTKCKDCKQINSFDSRLFAHKKEKI